MVGRRQSSSGRGVGCCGIVLLALFSCALPEVDQDSEYCPRFEDSPNLVTICSGIRVFDGYDLRTLVDLDERPVDERVATGDRFERVVVEEWTRGMDDGPWRKRGLTVDELGRVAVASDAVVVQGSSGWALNHADEYEHGWGSFHLTRWHEPQPWLRFENAVELHVRPVEGRPQREKLSIACPYLGEVTKLDWDQTLAVYRGYIGHGLTWTESTEALHGCVAITVPRFDERADPAMLERVLIRHGARAEIFQPDVQPTIDFRRWLRGDEWLEQSEKVEVDLKVDWYVDGFSGGEFYLLCPGVGAIGRKIWAGPGAADNIMRYELPAELLEQDGEVLRTCQLRWARNRYAPLTSYFWSGRIGRLHGLNSSGTVPWARVSEANEGQGQHAIWVRWNLPEVSRALLDWPGQHHLEFHANIFATSQFAEPNQSPGSSRGSPVVHRLTGFVVPISEEHRIRYRQMVAYPAPVEGEYRQLTVDLEVRSRGTHPYRPRWGSLVAHRRTWLWHASTEMPEVLEVAEIPVPERRLVVDGESLMAGERFSVQDQTMRIELVPNQALPYTSVLIGHPSYEPDGGLGGPWVMGALPGKGAYFVPRPVVIRARTPTLVLPTSLLSQEYADEQVELRRDSCDTRGLEDAPGPGEIRVCDQVSTFFNLEL